MHYPIEIVELALGMLREGRGPCEVARALGVSRRTLHRWRRGENMRRPRPGAYAIPEPEGRTERGRPMADGDGGKAPEERVAELEREVAELRLRNDYLEAIAQILGKGEAAPTAGERTEAVEELRRRGHSLSDALRAAGIARSTYSYRRRRARRADPDLWLASWVREAWEAGRGAYGYRRVASQLAAWGVPCGARRVRRIMGALGLSGRRTGRRRRWSSYAGEASPAPPNLVARDFRADSPGRLWLTDITELSVPAGKCYLSAVVDCFDGLPVAWRVAERATAELANSTLRAALATLPGARGADSEPLVVHSDRGGHYRWPGWLAICRENHVTRSMSAKGCSPDNARMEGFFGTLKEDLFNGRDFSGLSIGEFMELVGGWVAWYADGRLTNRYGPETIMGRRRRLGLAPTA